MADRRRPKEFVEEERDTLKTGFGKRDPGVFQISLQRKFFPLLSLVPKIGKVQATPTLDFA